MNDIMLFTTPIVQGYEVVEYKGLVTARSARAMHLIRDLFTAFRDVFGGRSESYEKLLHEIEYESIADLTAQARQLGANAIVGLNIDCENVSSKGSSIVMAYSKGTACVIRKKS